MAIPAVPAYQPTFPSPIVTDPLVVTTIGTVLSASFWLVCSQLILASPSALSVSAGAILGAVNLIKLGSYIRDHRKELFYEVSLIYSMARHYFFPTAYSWGHQIDNRLYLGAIPLHEYNHLENFRFRIRGPLAILSLLEPFELERKYVFPSAVAHDEWEDSGVKTLQLPAVDCEPVEQKMIEQGVQFIRDMNAEGRTVYVHCKAGVGRSATVVACKILQDGLANGTKFHSAQDAIQYVRSKRNFVIIHKGHARAAIEQFFQRLCAKP